MWGTNVNGESAPGAVLPACGAVVMCGQGAAVTTTTGQSQHPSTCPAFCPKGQQPLTTSPRVRGREQDSEKEMKAELGDGGWGGGGFAVIASLTYFFPKQKEGAC